MSISLGLIMKFYVSMVHCPLIIFVSPLTPLHSNTLLHSPQNGMVSGMCMHVEQLNPSIQSPSLKQYLPHWSPIIESGSVVELWAAVWSGSAKAKLVVRVRRRKVGRNVMLLLGRNWD